MSPNSATVTPPSPVRIQVPRPMHCQASSKSLLEFWVLFNWVDRSLHASPDLLCAGRRATGAPRIVDGTQGGSNDAHSLTACLWAPGFLKHFLGMDSDSAQVLLRRESLRFATNRSASACCATQHGISSASTYATLTTNSTRHFHKISFLSVTPEQ